MRGCATAASSLQPVNAPRAPSQWHSIVPAVPKVSPRGPLQTFRIGNPLSAPHGPERTLDGRLVLSSLQEQSLWAEIAASATPHVAQLAGASNRLAALAVEAHSLLCAYAPRFLNENTRNGWDQDAAVFSAWLEAFDESCRTGNLISSARLPLELIDALASDSAPRPPLLLAGFDRILPVQKNLFAAWGACTEAPLAEPASRIAFHLAADPASELAACALWCNRQLADNPDARLLVVSQDVLKHRGEIERAVRPLHARRSSTHPTQPASSNFLSGSR